jgi:hypothetical protein
MRIIQAQSKANKSISLINNDAMKRINEIYNEQKPTTNEDKQGVMLKSQPKKADTTEQEDGLATKALKDIINENKDEIVNLNHKIWELENENKTLREQVGFEVRKDERGVMIDFSTEKRIIKPGCVDK